MVARFNVFDSATNKPIKQKNKPLASEIWKLLNNTALHLIKPPHLIFPTNLTSTELAHIAVPDLSLNTVDKDYSCKKLIAGDKAEQQKVLKRATPQKQTILQPNDYIEQTQDCDVFRQTRKYAPYPLSQEEADFPIAYSILIFKDIEMFERMLRAIYRPQNYYCIHVDKKSSAEYKAAVQGKIHNNIKRNHFRSIKSDQ